MTREETPVRKTSNEDPKQPRPSGLAARRPVGRRLQARVFRIVNVPIRVALSLPVATPMSRRLMLVHLVGRKTGKHYRQPVSYVADGAALLTPGGGRWTRNLRDGRPVQVRLRGRRITAWPELIRDPDKVDRLLTLMSARNPALNRFVRIPTAMDGRRDRELLLRAIRYGFCIVRWRVDRSPAEPDQAEATRPSSAGEASKSLLGSTRTV
jgi:deazaflavin-dependent oxidoreductase (nitroreductase family)